MFLEAGAASKQDSSEPKPWSTDMQCTRQLFRYIFRYHKIPI